MTRVREGEREGWEKEVVAVEEEGEWDGVGEREIEGAKLLSVLHMISSGAVAASIHRDNELSRELTHIAVSIGGVVGASLGVVGGG